MKIFKNLRRKKPQPTPPELPSTVQRMAEILEGLRLANLAAQPAETSIPLGEFNTEEDQITMDVIAENTAMCCVPWGMEREALCARLRWAEELPPGTQLRIEAGPSECKRLGFKHFVVRRVDAPATKGASNAAA